MTDVARAEELRHHGDTDALAGLVDLAVNVRPGAPPQWLRERLAAVDLARYPDQAAAVSAVAARHGRAPDDVLLTAGAAEAFVLVARALLPELAVVVHPQFTEPEAALRAAGHAVDRLVLDEPFELDPSLVPRAADLIFVGNPTNPTGVLHSRETLRALVRPGRLVVVDEAFADCVSGETGSLAAEPDLAGLVIVRSLTKTWGLAGLRAGYLLAAPGVVEVLRSAQPLWPVSGPALAACVACSEPAAVAEAAAWAGELSGLRDHLVGLIDRRVPSARVVGPAAASYLLIHTERSDTRLRLQERGFAVRRGETFPGLDEQWIRVAVRDTATSTAFVDALQEVLA
jgi:histidinol-phosphate aminotransferase